ncbi:MAG: LuxR C-terminal-related transcriptional regulator [Sphingomonadales bacterium]
MRRDLFAPDANDTIQSVIDEGVAQLRHIGVIAGGYFLTPPFHSQISTKTIVVSFGLEPDVEKFLTDQQFLIDDPFPDFVMAAARPMTWRDVLARIELTEGQRRFVDFLNLHGLVDALSVPLFGSNGCDSYSAFILGRPIIEADEPLVKRIVDIARAMHSKLCIIASRDDRGNVSMSKRESEVLRWMAHGKSNADIATILGLAPATIDTFVRRIFGKLGVNDRISAVLAGLSRGIVQL